MRTLWPALVVAMGCGSREPTARPPGGPAHAPHDTSARHIAPVTAPHGGRITQVAITDTGDAALTADQLGELRLWLALDGTREPIAVRGPRPRQLAIGRHGGQIVAAVVDTAGGVELLRFDPDGTLTGRAKLPADPAAEQVAIAAGSVLVRRSDHSITAHDARGELRGRLVAGAGERVTSIAVRGPLAAAALEGRASTDGWLRWIVLGDRVAWGSSARLPVALDALAIAPGGARVAGMAPDGTGQIVELLPAPRIVATLSRAAAAPPRPRGNRPDESLATIGFFDDDHVGLSTRGFLELGNRDAATWTTTKTPAARAETTAAIADRVAVAGQAAGLAITQAGGTRYLGYRDLMFGQLLSAGAVTVRSARLGLLWLDDRLHVTRTTPAIDHGVTLDLSIVRTLDDHHLAILRRTTAPAMWVAVIRDVVSSTETPLVTAQQITDIQYDRGTRVLAVHADREIRQFRITLAPLAASPLPTLADVDPYRPVYLTDPVRAGGIGAVSVTAMQPPTILTFSADEDTAGLPVKPQSYPVQGNPIAVDRTGAVYTSTGSVLTIYRGGQRVEVRALKGAGRAAATSDGGLLAVPAGNEVIVLEAGGAERWRRSVWRATEVAWSADDRRLLVSSPGSLEALDARTGDRLAIACGWNFGLFDGEPTGNPSNTPSACAGP